MAHVNTEMRACIDACQSCHAVCVETLNHCLTMGGKHTEKEHVTTMLDCAQICATSADFMLRGSSLHAATCLACAEVCEACADSCDALGGAEMKRCATECRACAEECRKMAAAA